jgi:hypothetical protein
MQLTSVHPLLFVTATTLACSSAHTIGEEESPATLSEQNKDPKKTADAGAKTTDTDEKTADTAGSDTSAKNSNKVEMRSEEGCVQVAWAQQERDAKYREPDVDERHVGTWRGYPTTSSQWFPDDQVTLVINADGSGTFLVGPKESTLPEPQADEGYLCDTQESPESCTGGFSFIQGYSYSIKSAKSSLERLQFAIPLEGPYDPWCELQTPVDRGREYDEDGNLVDCQYSLYPAALGGRRGPDGCFVQIDEDTEEEIDCGYAAMANACNCYYDGCIADYGYVSVDIALFDDDDAMIGNIDGDAVQFRRVVD